MTNKVQVYITEQLLKKKIYIYKSLSKGVQI